MIAQRVLGLPGCLAKLISCKRRIGQRQLLSRSKSRLIHPKTSALTAVKSSLLYCRTPHYQYCFTERLSSHLAPFTTMSSNNSQTPDLASVLSILAGLTPQTQNLLTQAPSTPSIAAQAPQASPQQTWQPTAPPPPRSTTTPTEPPPSAVKLVDPATIIEWSSGLRCVMKTVAKHDTMLLEIRRVRFPFVSLFMFWGEGRLADLFVR